MILLDPSQQRAMALSEIAALQRGGAQNTAPLSDRAKMQLGRDMTNTVWYPVVASEPPRPRSLWQRIGDFASRLSIRS